MGGLRQYIAYGAAGAVITGLVAIVGGPSYWESRQPEELRLGAVVRHIEPYNIHGDLYLPSRGKRILIEGEDMVIDFPQNRWDNTVEEGGIVSIVVRPSFPWFGLVNKLDGLHINDHAGDVP